MTPHHVQHVMRHIRGGNIIGDHLHAIGAIGSGSLLNIGAAHHRRRRDTICRCSPSGFRHNDVFFYACDSQLEMQHRTGVGLNDYVLASFPESPSMSTVTV